MKKMKLQMLGLSVNDLLSREQMKKVMGGSGSGSGAGGSGSGPSGCGVKVNGNWHPSGASASTTSGYLGKPINGTDTYTWWSNDGGSSYVQGNYSGTVTNWCCDSCPWNQPNYA